MATPLSSRTGLIVVAALAVGWVSGSLTQPDLPAPAPASVARRLADVKPVPQAEKLRARLAEPPQPARGRNPFVFGSRTSARAAVTRDHQQHGEEPVVPAPAEPVAPPLPVFRLSGIASTTVGGTAVLTAIIIDNGSMVFAKNGDTLSNGYTVVRVDETSVTLTDAAGVTQTIRLP